MYRAMLVGLGYSRLPEVDHKDNFLPVVLDTTFRCKLVLALINDWDMEVVDIDSSDEQHNVAIHLKYLLSS